MTGPTAGWRIALVMGVSGAGKTTIGRALASALGWEFIDADDFHAPTAIDKMRRGEPLTDADRAPWLAHLQALIAGRARVGPPLVLACSALSAAHRTQLGLPNPAVAVVLLEGPEPLLRARLRARQDHFVGDALLTSQLALLDPPPGAIRVEVVDPPAVLVDRIRAALAAGC
jgi:gluconokinase